MALPKRLLAKELHLNSFRSFVEVTIPLGKRMTIISGVNGVGKSNIISLISSGSGVSKKSSLGSNFQPEFSDFFNIDVSENFADYKLYVTYAEENGKYALTKRLSFKDDTPTNRGIRIIPRTSCEYSEYENNKAAEESAKLNYGVGGAGRVLIPTIYLSLSRLYPLGERRSAVTVTKIKKSSPYAQNDIMQKYREWYNYVIPGAIMQDADYSMVEKQASSRASLHMDIENTPTLSQSIGQDNVGNIISALVDIYRLSLENEYNGAILCIDEIEVSLHPDTQVRMLNLLDALSESLKIQIVVSTHSLTVLKECLKKEENQNGNYRVVYLKNPQAPYVTERKEYSLLKADMLGDLQFSKVHVKMYFEDDIGKQLFLCLLSAYQHVLEEVKGTDEKALRHSEDVPEYKAINERIKSLEGILKTKESLQYIVTHMGCDTLLKVMEADTYFKRVIFMLDGDARLVSNKPHIKDYLDSIYNIRDYGQSERKHSPNVIFAPGYFAPESYLYKIIRRLYTDVLDNSSFWRGLDAKEDTALYTSDKIKSLFSGLQSEFTNDDLKSIFGESVSGEVWDFILNSDILSFYYADYKNIIPLLEFIEKYQAAFNMTYPLTVSNRYS